MIKAMGLKCRWWWKDYRRRKRTGLYDLKFRNRLFFCFVCLLLFCFFYFATVLIHWDKVRIQPFLTVIVRLSITGKSDQYVKIKRNLLQAVVVSILFFGCTTFTLTKSIDKKLDGNYTKCYELYWRNAQSNIPSKTATRSLTSHL